VAVDTLYYFGESVLLPQFRGQGIGHRFFDEREAAARAAFWAVVRQDDDPRRPNGARDLQGFWRNRGYSLAPGCDTRLSWKEVGAAQESEHLMRFWIRRL